MSDHLTIGFDVNQQDAIAQELGVVVLQQVRNAAFRAAEATAIWLRALMLTDLAGRVPALQSFWTRRLLKFVDANVKHGKVWLGLWSPHVATKNFPLVAMFQRGQGAYLGTTYFEGGFIAHMPSGTVGIFNRWEGVRKDIHLEQLELPVDDELISQWEEKGIAHYKEEFDKALQDELERASFH